MLEAPHNNGTHRRKPVRSLFVLHEQPRLGAQLLADIHLRPTLTAACKIIHSAVYHAAKTEVTEEKNSDNMREFKYNGILLMPPYPGPNPWVDWAKSNYHHIWWLIETAWWADKELQHRFYTPQSLMYLRTNKIVEEGCSRHFSKPNHKEVKDWPLPPGNIHLSGSEVDTHKQIYKSLKGKMRLKWTNRETPAFMIGDAKSPKTLCPDCKAPKPLNGVCDDGCYYGRN